MLILLIVCFIAGSIGAILQGMLGVGTGVIIVPLLTTLLPKYGIDPDLAIHIAIATSMAAIAINSISSLRSHHYRGNIQWPIFQKIILFSLAGSCVGAITASYTPGNVLHLIFGFFLILTALHMLLKKAVNDKTDAIPDFSVNQIAPQGFSIGLIASIIGSGGGILMVPFLHSQKLKMRYAVGTSTLIGFPVAIIGALTYIWIGASKIPATAETIGYLHWPALLAITIAGTLSAPIGVKLSSTLSTTLLSRFFAALIMGIGIHMIISQIGSSFY